MKGREKLIFLLVSLVFWCVLAADTAHAKDVVLSDEAKGCLGCHEKRGILKKFQNNESVEAYVNAVRFKASAHSSLGCSSCHMEFSPEKHPERRFRSIKQYQIQSSLVCKRCHTLEQIKKKAIHAGLIKEEEKGKATVCTECHSSHAIMPVAGGRVFTNEAQYCLSCHGHGLTMMLKNGETVSLTIDKSLLEGSIHNKLSCSDCHYGFSSEDHPQRSFRTKREYTLAVSESCRRCHFDKYTKTMESTHYAVLTQGNTKAPVCTDCHGSHEIRSGRVEKLASGKRCKQCHEDVFSVYVSSVHGKALVDEHNQDVPICVDCHMAHNVQDLRTREHHERIPEMCANCHANKTVMGRYGLSTNVVKTYLSDFHGVTLGLYKKQREEIRKPSRPIAVCTDCHGTHNITSTRSIEPAVLKANLAKRCQQCHKDAPKNFPDTWLSHYEPSLKSAPLVFIVNSMYKVFIPVLVLGLFLQILLHIWRYAIDR
jgi:predicted CXXCH cytochrome family protein